MRAHHTREYIFKMLPDQVLRPFFTRLTEQTASSFAIELVPWERKGTAFQSDHREPDQKLFLDHRAE